MIRDVEGQRGPPVNLPLHIFVVVYHVPSEINSSCIVSVSRNIIVLIQFTRVGVGLFGEGVCVSDFPLYVVSYTCWLCTDYLSLDCHNSIMTAIKMSQLIDNVYSLHVVSYKDWLCTDY